MATIRFFEVTDSIGEKINFRKREKFGQKLQIWLFFLFWHKSPKIIIKKQKNDFSLFLGVMATFAATFGTKIFFEIITRLSKVHVQVFERKPSAYEHATDIAYVDHH